MPVHKCPLSILGNVGFFVTRQPAMARENSSVLRQHELLVGSCGALCWCHMRVHCSCKVKFFARVVAVCAPVKSYHDVHSSCGHAQLTDKTVVRRDRPIYTWLLVTCAWLGRLCLTFPSLSISQKHCLGRQRPDIFHKEYATMCVLGFCWRVVSLECWRYHHTNASRSIDQGQPRWSTAAKRYHSIKILWFYYWQISCTTRMYVTNTMPSHCRLRLDEGRRPNRASHATRYMGFGLWLLPMLLRLSFGGTRPVLVVKAL